MLYHAETGIPFNINLPVSLDLFYSDHAQRAATSDRYGRIDLHPSILTVDAKVIEVETCDRTGNPIKVLLRKPHDERNDICLAIALNSSRQGRFVVKTVWLNRKDDLHKTLNKKKYKQAN